MTVCREHLHNPYGKIGELPTSLPLGCTWASEWAANGNFAMQIRLHTTSIYGNSGQLSGQLSRQPTTSKYEKSGQLSGQRSGLPMGCPWEFFHANKAAHYFHIWKQWAAQWAAHYFQTFKKICSSVCSGVGCPCAAHGNFAMQIRLSTTAIYGYSGQLSGQLSA